ncbi:uncharacterized protein TRIADDRAFT_29833 [Trichoplax adhaerens]|uniref:Mannosyltransferase n=1 Tax=Trichoplax adhaerens TaxID=10228 RepID=B3S611_TRIAD|nr:hypothetical protein TRIADDRAFT_29833 [Trichoplax adhaerens]EDV22011.1 hypothetical protein TRIADDRAFT_29833 [Trichoplax adhaerens]|eukprot:XP_002115648.1 hypothetical protein TRIADDRAFT_29833 [Trichoplax adhaerens]
MDIRHRFTSERSDGLYLQHVDDQQEERPVSRKRSQWPGALLALQLLLFARIIAALTVHVTDCDETFNYWEPMHYMLYGNGLQTWEYSPQFAIRSYAYVLLHAVFAWPVQFLSLDKIYAFYLVRIWLGVCCAVSEAYFYRGISKFFDARMSRYTLVFLLIGSGMYISSAAFLPSSFTMLTTMAAYGALFHGNYKMFIFAIGLGTLWGWPFVAVLGIPGAVYIALCQNLITYFIKWTFIWLIVIMAPLLAIDSYYYGKLTIAPLNIVMYNVLSGKGPELYGVESWTFYFINGFLNFNVAFVLAICSLPIWVCNQSIPLHSVLTVLSPMYLWIGIFFTRPHKEERFLFPIYPLIACSAAMALSECQNIYKNSHSFIRTFFRLGVASTFLLYMLLSLSRTMVLHIGYQAPIEVYKQLPTLVSEYKSISKFQDINVCVGKEWHRFPSNFFLPNRYTCQLQFVKSEFRGQLPKPYEAKPLATRIIPTDMNDQNKEEPSRYFKIQNCHILVDLETSVATPFEPSYSKDVANWKSIITYPFLDANRSHKLLRAFYVPVFSAKKIYFNQYIIMTSTNLIKMSPQKL